MFERGNFKERNKDKDNGEEEEKKDEENKSQCAHSIFFINKNILELRIPFYMETIHTI